MAEIAIVDYGMGNLRSVSKAIEHVAPGSKVSVTREASEILAASHVVFPGQGAMPDCMRELDSRGLRDAVVRAACEKPFLGICIGLQMLFDFSEEGSVAGLGILKGKVKRFPQEKMHDASGEKMKVPHIGWNGVEQCAFHPLWEGIGQDSRFYFVHSYYVEPDDEGIVAAYSRYPFRFAAAVAKDNIFAVQFHPEKSQSAGLALLRNFSLWNGKTSSGEKQRSC
ncbi:MAG: imidazole glycerol phosphate synthase subunit HisH [Burkholderiales bacterium]|nr:imidazole glycerol phosphate synthase subunit HisH [Burkholderiales bacterium]